MNFQRERKRVLRLVLAAMLMVDLGISLVNATILVGAGSKVHFRAQDLPAVQMGVVLGTDSPEAIQRRASKAFEALQAGKVKKLLLSGNENNRGFNEVEASRAALLQLGASPAQLLLDGQSLRTIDSIREARRRCPDETVVLVSDDYHVGRALWLAQKLGLQAVALGAPSGYSPGTLKSRCREVLARVKAFLEIHFTNAN